MWLHCLKIMLNLIEKKTEVYYKNLIKIFSKVNILMF